MTIPRQLLITGIICALLSGFIVYQAQNMRFERKIAENQAVFDRQLNAITTAAQQATADAMQRMKDAQAAAAELDKKTTQDLANVKAENDRLRADVAAGTRRVRIAAANLATCQLSASRGASTGGVGDGVQIDLSAEGGRAVLDLRESAATDGKVISYLQGYIRDVVKQCKR